MDFIPQHLGGRLGGSCEITNTSEQGVGNFRSRGYSFTAYIEAFGVLRSSISRRVIADPPMRVFENAFQF